MDIFDCDEEPGQVVAVADAFDTCGFGWKTSNGVETPDCALDAGELIDVMDGVRREWAGGGSVEQCEVGKNFGGGRYNVG